MRTIKKATIEYEICDAPATPLNLQMGPVYAPRGEVGDGAFIGFSCMEVEPGWFVVAGWTQERTATVWEGDSLPRAYAEFARQLRMNQ